MISGGVWLAAGGLVAGLMSSALHAQSAAPITVTPPTLAPAQSGRSVQIEIPETGALSPPPGADQLSVVLRDVEVEGSFAEVRRAVEAIVAPLRGRSVSITQIYQAASAIEAAHARAGYVLARVSVPPQQLRDGGVLRIVVTDGFIEKVDVGSLPARVRSPVADRVRALEGRRHLTLGEIEQPLLLAGEVPGLTLRSTLIRGEQAGGARIILEGSQAPVTGSVAIDNGLDPSLGRWGVTAQIALNDLLGAGEQIYGFAAADYDARHWFDDRSRSRVIGTGALVPLGPGRLVINPELTYSRTAPEPGAGAPASIGTLHRYSLRAAYTLSKDRGGAVVLNGSIEQLDEKNRLPLFDVDLSHDRYMAARLGLNLSRQRGAGWSYWVLAQLSQGLGDLGGISSARATASGIGYSRVGANNDFTKLVAQGRASWSVGRSFEATLFAKGQSSFGKPLLRAEQFALEGTDAVSAYVGGATAVDEGVAARAELATPVRLGSGAGGAVLSPYVFDAVGYGSIARPTALEPRSLQVGAFGAGARLNLPRLGWSLWLEYAHGVADFAPLDKRDRVSVATALRF